MNAWSCWVLDASMASPPGTFCFCPVEGDIDGEHNVIYGMNYVGSKPPGKLVGIIHEDGQEAVERWCEEHAVELEAMG